MATFMERLAFLQKVPTLMKATADDENPCPGYVFQEIGKISHESSGCGQCLLEYLLERLQVESCHVKLKVLKIFVHLCGHGSNNFLTELRRNSTFILQASVYSGPPDPIHGTALYQKVRNTAQEVARLLFTDTVSTRSSLSPCSPATPSMVETILGLTGATMGSLICFICPALIYRKIQKNGLVAQLVLWVGLGILLISTFTTLSISSSSPTPNIQAPPPPAPDKSHLLKPLPDLLELHGVAVPEGEAHRHEPPIPHDEVKVDERKNDAELEEEKIQPVPPAGEEGESQGDGEPAVKEKKEEEKGEDKQKSVVAVVRKEEVDLGGGEVQSNEVQENPVPEAGEKQEVPQLKEVEKLAPVKELPAGKAAVVADQAVAAQVDDAVKAPEAAGKAPVPEGEHHAAADGAVAADSKDAAEDKMDVIKKLVAEGQLDHAVLLQVIKEQQKQQKRLLDQQEKLLAVIQEQHKEIHQKQPGEGVPEGEGEKAVQEHLEVMEGGAVKPNDPAQGGNSDPKQPGDPAGAGAGAPQVGVAEPHVVPQNQAQAGGKSTEDQAPNVVAPVAYKEDAPAPAKQAAGAAVAAAVEAQRDRELGARGVPLGQKGPDHRQAVPKKDQLVLPKDEERDLDREKEKIERDRAEKERIEKEVQARVEKERLERLEKERIEKEVQARVEKERLERERREKLAREQELERASLEKEKAEKERAAKERAEKERLAEERAAKELAEREEKERLKKERVGKERIQQEMQKADNEVVERVRKEEELEETRKRLAQLERAIEDNKVADVVQGVGEDEGDSLKKGGRDLKERAAPQADSREVLDDGDPKAQPQPPESQEKARNQDDTDLRRRRRALEDAVVSRGMPGLEPLLELGGSDLYAALEGQLLGGAMVHTRQLQQATEAEEKKM